MTEEFIQVRGQHNFLSELQICTFKQGKRKSREHEDSPKDNMHMLEQNRTRKGSMKIGHSHFSEALQLQRNILTSEGQNKTKQVMPWAAVEPSSAGYLTTDLNITRDYVSEPGKYETEKQGKDYPATRNTQSDTNLDPEQKFAEQFKREPDVIDY